MYVYVYTVEYYTVHTYNGYYTKILACLANYFVVIIHVCVNFQARLVHIPMKPAYVFPVLFAIATVCSIATITF